MLCYHIILHFGIILPIFIKFNKKRMLILIKAIIRKFILGPTKQSMIKGKVSNESDNKLKVLLKLN